MDAASEGEADALIWTLLQCRMPQIVAGHTCGARAVYTVGVANVDICTKP